jgi:intracellular multiplication protein IcmK
MSNVTIRLLLALVGIASVGVLHAGPQQGGTLSQAAALAATGLNNESQSDRAVASLASDVGNNTSGPTAQAAAMTSSVASGAARVTAGAANAVGGQTSTDNNSSEWVNAGSPAEPAAPSAPPQPAPVADSYLAGFPGQGAGTVIAPPVNAFPATSRGPESYGVNGNNGQSAQPGQPSAAASLPAPPIIQQARDIDSPLSPDEIRELRADFEATHRAESEDPITPVPRISSISVDLSPGGAPPVLHTMRNQPSSIVFLDSTGAPWPLGASPRIASSGYFDVKWLKETAAVVVTATSAYKNSGMEVFLKGLATPIVVQLSSGEPDSKAKTRVVDYRLDLRIPGRGPNAKQNLLGPSRIGMYDDALQAFLDGVPPSGAKRIGIEGEAPTHTEVWELGDSLYLRTPLEIRSAFEQTMASADGTHIYKLDPTPLIMVSDGGENVSLSLDIE